MLTKRQYEILKAVTTKSDILEEDKAEVDFLIKNQYMHIIPLARGLGFYPYQIGDIAKSAMEEYERYIKQDKRDEKNSKSNIAATVISGIALAVSAVALIISIVL